LPLITVEKWKWLAITLFIAIAAIGISSRNDRPEHRSRFPISTESEVAELHDAVVVLATAPETCLTCEPALAPWIDAARIPVVLLLTSTPPDRAAREIARIRLPFPVVVASAPVEPREPGTIRAVLYCRKQVKDSLTARGMISRSVVSERFATAEACTR
jgi:hypothetical protein